MPPDLPTDAIERCIEETPMSEKWTPEPWNPWGLLTQTGITHEVVGRSADPESEPVALLGVDDYGRACACVNACTSMVDPAKEIKLLRDQNAAMRMALEKAAAWCRCRGTGFYQTDCTLCGDSTYDHYCNETRVECELGACKSIRAALAATKGTAE